MAIAFVNSAVVATITSSYTVGSGNNRILILAVVGGIDPTDTISAATYGGQSMTLITKNAQNNRWIYLFYLVNPPSGSNAFSITDGGNFNNAFCADFTGANQVSQPDASGTTGLNTVSSILQAVTTVDDNCWLVGTCFFASGGSSLTAQAGTTIRQNQAANSALFDSNGAKTPAGSYALGINDDVEVSDAVIIVASISPNEAAPTTSTTTTTSTSTTSSTSTSTTTTSTSSSTSSTTSTSTSLTTTSTSTTITSTSTSTTTTSTSTTLTVTSTSTTTTQPFSFIVDEGIV